MPKQKTHKGTAKRFKKTATGKLKRSSSGRRHLLDCKSAKRKRQLRGGGLVHKADAKRLVNLIP